MTLSDKFMRKFRNFGVESLIIYIIITIGIIWAVDYIFPAVGITNYLYFSRSLIFSGEIWRLVTFMFMPQSSGVLGTLITLYFYYFIGTSLESFWGKQKFTLYMLIGMILLIIAGLIAGCADAYYLYLSLFIAYALISPNTELLLFFVIPVKVKYLAFIDVVLTAYLFFIGGISAKASIIAAVVLLLIFFGRPLIGRIKAKKRKNDFEKNFRNR